MLSKLENQFSITRAALSTRGRARSNVLSLVILFCFWIDPCFAEERKDADVIVVGAGISGLTASLSLAKHGAKNCSRVKSSQP
jgi:FAD binding domain